MLGSPNLYRGNAPLMVRLRIHDLHAQLAPLERYGVGAMSFALTGGVRALVRGFDACVRQNENKLLSSQTASYILSASALIQETTKRAQKRVTRLMAESIIETFEVINVEHQ